MIPHINDGKDEENIVKHVADYVTCYDKMLLNRPLKLLIAFILVAVTAPFLLYCYVFIASGDTPPTDGYSIGSCLLPRDTRLLCGFGYENASECHPQCCYDENNNICYHRLPSRFSYIAESDWYTATELYPRISTVPFKNQESIKVIKLSMVEVSSTHLTMVFNNNEKNISNRNIIENKTYTYEVSTRELNIIVIRTDKNATIFNTLRGPLVASENIWEITFMLTEEIMFGLGELPLKAGTEKVIYNHNRGLSSVPLIFAKSNGSYHGLLIDIEEPTEVKINERNHLVIRSITSTGLKFHLFLGPEPKDIMHDVMKLIGFKQELHYWMLGAHICSEKSETSSKAYEDLIKFLHAAEKENLPYESHCGIKPTVFQNSQCLGKNHFIEEGAQSIQNFGKKYIPQISPYIVYKNINEISEIQYGSNGTEKKDYNFTNSSPKPSVTCQTIIEEYSKIMLHSKKEVYKGIVGDYGVIYPDYENVTREFMIRLWSPDIDLDGVILENTWPLDESIKIHYDTYNSLPYFNKNFQDAFNNTPQWNVTRPNGDIYVYNHNEYGNNFVQAFKKLFVKEPLQELLGSEVIPMWTSSQRMNGEVLINRKNINATWENLQRELIGAALGGISGHWLWSSPVCGDTEHFDVTVQVDLCVKWYMAAAYMPLIKIDSKTPLRHPLSFAGINKMYMMIALRNRQSLMPYFYKILQEGPLLRPMFYQFPASERLKELNTQFSVGDDLLIVPNLQPYQSHVHVRMPPGTWYELKSGFPLVGEEGEAITMTTTNADLLTLIRAGSIIVTLKEEKYLSEKETRRASDFVVTIALECLLDTEENAMECKAKGSLFMSKDMSIIFETDGEMLSIKAEGNDFSVFCDADVAIWTHNISNLNVFGLEEELNNLDYNRHVDANIDLCQLKQNNIKFLIEYDGKLIK